MNTCHPGTEFAEEYFPSQDGSFLVFHRKQWPKKSVRSHLCGPGLSIDSSLPQGIEHDDHEVDRQLVFAEENAQGRK